MLANKVWRNITIRQIRQTLVPPNFRRLRYIHKLFLLGFQVTKILYVNFLALSS